MVPSGKVGTGSLGRISTRGKGLRKPEPRMRSETGSYKGLFGGFSAGVSLGKPSGQRLGKAGKGESDSEAKGEEVRGGRGKNLRSQS